MKDEQAKQRAHHGVEHGPRLVSQEDYQERALQKAESGVAAQSAKMIAQRNGRPARNETRDRRQQRRQRNGQKNIRGPNPGGGHRLEPGNQ